LRLLSKPVLLKVKFIQGLFDNPFTNVDEAVKIVGNPDFIAAGELAQRKSVVLLKNTIDGNKKTLPFELPSSMEAVTIQKEDLPYDSTNPLFKFGFGLSYN
jgi:hypothetical protein